MQSKAALLLSLVAGAGLTVLLIVTLARREPIERLATPPDSLSSRVESLARQVEALQARASLPRDAILDRLDSLEARLDALGDGGGEGPVESRPTPSRDEDLSGVSTEDLALRARLSHGSADFGAAIRLWQEVLARDLDEKARIEALEAVGAAYRAVKDHAREEKVFRIPRTSRRGGPCLLSRVLNPALPCISDFVRLPNIV